MEIPFLDESGLQSRFNVRRTLAQAGARPVIRVKEGERNKLSFIWAASREGISISGPTQTISLAWRQLNSRDVFWKR